MIARIVVPLDGSDTAELALPRAEQLAQEHGAPIHLVRVIDITGVRGYSTFLALERSGLDGALDAEGVKAATYLEGVRQRLRERGCPATSATPQGRAVQTIVNLLRPGDIVVMTTHGKGRGPRWFLGRVADEVQRYCRTAIELVPAPQLPVGEHGLAMHQSDQGLGAT